VTNRPALFRPHDDCTGNLIWALSTNNVVRMESNLYRIDHGFARQARLKLLYPWRIDTLYAELVRWKLDLQNSTVVLVEYVQDHDNWTKFVQKNTLMTQQESKSWLNSAVVTGLFPSAHLPTNCNSILRDFDH
jgi:hypothetical protein